jgi:hypothetical protein
MGSDNSKGYMLHATLRRTCTTRRTTKNKEAQLIFRSLSHDPGSSLAVVFWLKAIFCPRLADIWHDDKFPLIIGGRDCIKDAWFVKVIIPTRFPSRQLSTRRVFTSGISRPSEVLLPGHPRGGDGRNHPGDGAGAPRNHPGKRSTTGSTATMRPRLFPLGTNGPRSSLRFTATNKRRAGKKPRSLSFARKQPDELRRFLRPRCLPLRPPRPLCRRDFASPRSGHRPRLAPPCNQR